MSTAKNMVDAADRALKAIEKGDDTVVTTSGWVRALAASEGRDGGEYRRTLGLREEPGWGGVAREAFSSLYGGSEAVEAEKAPEGSGWMRDALSQAQSLPEWAALQSRSQGDEWATGVAASAALDVLAQTLPKLPEEDPAEVAEELKYLGDMQREQGKASPEHIKRMASAKRRLERAQQQAQATQDALKESVAVLRSKLRGAAKEASQAIDDGMAGLDGLGCGSDAGQRARVSAPRSEVLQAMRNDPKLARVAKLAGRLKSQAARKQAEKSAYARTELTDVVTGDDIARLLPSEWALLADEDTEILLYAKLAEKRALQYLLSGKESKTEGPIILAIDESGSMSGARDEWAKAIALALAEIAARQGRAFCVLHFDTGIQHEQHFENPKTMDFEAVMDLVTHFSGGGTYLEAPLLRSRAILTEARANNSKLGKADVILITDGIDDSDLGPQIKVLHDLGASAFLFAVDCPVSPAHRAVFDGAEHISASDLSGPSKKLDEAFSI